MTARFTCGIVALTLFAANGAAAQPAPKTPIGRYLDSLVTTSQPGWSMHVNLVVRSDDGAEHLFQGFHAKQFTKNEIEVNSASGYVRLHAPGESEYIIPFDNIAFAVVTDIGPPPTFRLDLHLKRSS